MRSLCNQPFDFFEFAFPFNKCSVGIVICVIVLDQISSLFSTERYASFVLYVIHLFVFAKMYSSSRPDFM